MPNTWLVSFIGWVAVTAGVIALATYRKVLSSKECDVLHLRESEMPLVPQQEELAHRLETVDHWGKVLTVASVSYGLVLGGVFLYQIWSQGITV
jgi:hypothetical protein